MDSHGKDSWQFMKAGADEVAVISHDQLAVFKPIY